LISGGILGGSLVAAAGFMYFGYWLTRLVRDGQAQTRDLARLLERVDARLEAIEAAAAIGSPGPRPPARGNNGHRGGTSFVATANGTMYHLPDCAIVDGKPGVRRVGPDGDGLKPCRICTPDAVALD
jgi:hypothetical protein